ncbi:uncharacterized protein [Porites lutea]|uniref:uncharacterized protein n=1 Tax=Porites lutea TaxID=51062 RepID=UPI003CC59F0B
MKMKSSYAVVAVILFACIIQMETAKVLSKATEEEDTRAGRTRRQSVLITGWKVCDGPAQPICPFAKQLLDCKFAGSMTCKYSSRRRGFECPSVFNIIDCCTARCL